MHPGLLSEEKGMTANQLREWVAQRCSNAAESYTYPAKPSAVQLLHSSHTNEGGGGSGWIWTDRVDDCVVLVGLRHGGGGGGGGVMAHLSWQCDWDQLSLQLGQTVSLYPRWFLLTNQPSPFSTRILVLLHRLRGLEAEPVSIDAPSHILTQHGWPRRQKRVAYHKIYFDPARLNNGEITPRTTAIVVDTAAQRIYIVPHAT